MQTMPPSEPETRGSDQLPLVNSMTAQMWLLISASVGTGSWLQMTTISPLAMHSRVELLNKLAMYGSLASRKPCFRL